MGYVFVVVVMYNDIVFNVDIVKWFKCCNCVLVYKF